jgi:ABC-2 type transport system ATP-binding protein
MTHAANVSTVRSVRRKAGDAPEETMIEVRGLTKRYGEKLAVDALSFDVRPGIVTGFLGPNGAGKSTTMRMIIGLDAPSAGSVTVNGRNYSQHPAPLHEVGALLEARSVHPSRTAAGHLLALASTCGIGRRRVAEVLDLVGLAEVADKRVGSFSLGMGQRLGIAAALLGDPDTVMLDEPVNGLDPEGVLWVRTLLRGLAEQGRTVFVSSHLMSEMALTAERLVVVGRGRLIRDESTEQFIESASTGRVHVRSPQAAQLRELLLADGVQVATSAEGELDVQGLSSDVIGARAAAGGLVLQELTPVQASLEQAFMKLTADSVEYRPNGEPSLPGDGRPAFTDSPFYDRIAA